MSATTAPQAVPVTEGRAANGQFVKGNKFGRGKPFARQVAQLVNRMRWLQAVGMEAEFNKTADKEREQLLLDEERRAKRDERKKGGPRAVSKR